MKCQGIVLVQYLSDASAPFFYLPGLQEAATQRFDQLFESGQHTEIGEPDVSRMLAEEEVLRSEPYRIRTCDTLIKRQVLISSQFHHIPNTNSPEIQPSFCRIRCFIFSQVDDRVNNYSGP